MDILLMHPFIVVLYSLRSSRLSPNLCTTVYATTTHLYLYRILHTIHSSSSLFTYPLPTPFHSPEMEEAEKKYLHVLAHHSNHQVEKSNGLDESETQNSVREQLAPHAGVTGHGHQESSEHHADTDTGTTETDGSGTHAQVLGDLHHGGGDLGGEATASGHVAAGVREDLRGLLTLDGAEGGGLLAGLGADARGDACWDCVS